LFSSFVFAFYPFPPLSAFSLLRPVSLVRSFVPAVPDPRPSLFTTRPQPRLGQRPCHCLMVWYLTPAPATTARCSLGSPSGPRPRYLHTGRCFTVRFALATGCRLVCGASFLFFSVVNSARPEGEGKKKKRKKADSTKQQNFKEKANIKTTLWLTCDSRSTLARPSLGSLINASPLLFDFTSDAISRALFSNEQMRPRVRHPLLH
jgi:hypothetical protein